MDDWKIKFRVGVMVFSTGLIAAILILLLGDRPAIFQRTWPVEIRLPDAPSVAKNTPIRKSGVLVGRITDVKLLPEGGVILKAAINDDVKINANEVCQVQSSLFGDTSLRLVLPPGKKASKEWLEPNAIIQGETAPDPFQTVSNMNESLDSVVKSVSDTSVQLKELINNIDKMLGENRKDIDSIIDKTNNILASVEKTTQFTDKILGNEKINNDQFSDDLAREISMMPQMLANAREAVAKLGTTMDNMNTTMALVDDNLKNIRDFTEPLGKNAPQMVDNMNDAVKRLNNVLSEFDRFSRTINGTQGTLGKLLHDDELYNNLNQAACNIQQLSCRLRPIVNDVRIFTDKMARHPGAPIRDAIMPGTGTKGPIPPRSW